MAAFLSGVIALAKVIPLIDSAIRQLFALYVVSYDRETLIEIADAAALSARAESQDERFKAADAWQKALTRVRHIS
jgi:hypothetical protein